MLRSFRCDAARVFALAVWIGSTACGPESVSKGAPVSTAASPQPTGGRDTVHVATSHDSTAPDTTKRVAAISPDTSSHRAVDPSTPVHRTAQDSVSYRAAI